jgi:hypothetical protein
VFTKPEIVEKILDDLENHFAETRNIPLFEDLTLKWLDPAAGHGVFFDCVFKRLMKGLKL